MPDSRKTAVKALLKVECDGAYSNIAINDELKCSKLTGADAALASALFYGVLERKYTIDWYISKVSSKPIRKIPPYIKNVLRIALYQMLYMDRIPDFAAINEAVKLIKSSNRSNASGFVNAILRSIQRNKSSFIVPDDRTVKSLSIRYSCESWIVEKLLADYGYETVCGILESSGEVSTTYLRVNTVRYDLKAVSDALKSDNISAVKINENCISIKGSVENTTAYKKGMFHVQDIASQQCCDALDVRDGMRVLDVCAAPGGKTFTVAENMNGTGTVVSRDLHEHRVKLIADGAARLGLNNISASVGDASEFDEDIGLFDRVLCDVPCSGIGVIRRKPDIKYKKQDGIDALPEAQYKILETASKYVKIGGTIVYSTCTLFKSENEGVFQKFLSEHDEFESFPFEGGEYMMTLLPQNGTDGFFYARAVRKG